MLIKLQAGRSGVRIPEKVKIFVYSRISRMLWDPQPVITYVPVGGVPGIKRLGAMLTNHTEVKNVSSCINIPHICVRGVDMDNVALILPSYPEKNASLTLHLL